jgi:hypothetical protein
MPSGRTSPDRFQAEQGRASDRREAQGEDAGAGGNGQDPSAHSVEQAGVAGLQQAAAQHYVDIPADQAQPADHPGGHGDQLVGQPVDDRTSHLVAGCGGGEYQRRELGQVALGEAAEVDRLDNGVWPGETKVGGNKALECGPGAASIPTPDGGG